MFKTRLSIPEKSNTILEAWEIHWKADEAREGFYYLPSNACEAYIVLEGCLTREVVGTNRTSELTAGNGYFGLSRPRAMRLTSDHNVSFVLIKVESSLGFDYCSKIEDGNRNRLWPLETLIDDWQVRGHGDDIMKLISLLQVYAQEQDQPGLVHTCLQLIRRSNGKIRVKDLNDQLGVCKSTLEEKFNQLIGLSPKEVCKIEKLNFFLSNYHENSDLSLTELTFKSGYYDQSHLIKDFKYFVDQSPKKYLKQTKSLDAILI